MTDIEPKLERLNGTELDNELGIIGNLYKVGINTDDVDRVSKKAVYTLAGSEKEHTATHYIIHIDDREYTVCVHEESELIEF